MYELKSDDGARRSYVSRVTGTEVFTNLIYTDGNENKWWSFEDLLQIPFIRKKAAEKVSQLYGVGMTREDLTNFIARLKSILKDTDPEKYERAYSELLNMETIADETNDAVKQSLSLCSVYIMADDERIDTFSFTTAVQKMKVWEMDLDAQSFFLRWFTDGMNDFTKLYSSIIPTALTSNA